jgi:hypothetical protein
MTNHDIGNCAEAFLRSFRARLPRSWPVPASIAAYMALTTIDLRNSNTVLCLRRKIMTAVDISHEGHHRSLGTSSLRAIVQSRCFGILIGGSA